VIKYNATHQLKNNFVIEFSSYNQIGDVFFVFFFTHSLTQFKDRNQNFPHFITLCLLVECSTHEILNYFYDLIRFKFKHKLIIFFYRCCILT